MLARLFATLLICSVGIGLGQVGTPPRSRSGEPSAGDAIVSGLRVEAISHSSAKVVFNTAIPGSNTAVRVDYGTVPGLGFQTNPVAGGSGSATARYQLIAGLRPATRYYFRPVVSDNNRKFDTSWRCPAAGSFPGYACESRGSLAYFVTLAAPEVLPVPPELPASVDTAMPAINGATFSVAVDAANRCTDLQQQLEAAAAADTSRNHQVVIPAGASCYGQYVLPKKVGPGVVVIRPSTPDNLLPPPGVRIDPSYRARMAKLSTPPLAASLGQEVRPALRTARCSGVCTEGWRLVGIEITHPRHDEIPPTVRNIVSIKGDIVTVDQPHGLAHFNKVHVAGVQGMKGANGTWQIGVFSPTSFRIRGAQTSGTYSGGGHIVHALSSAIADCSNTSPIVCTTVTPHGLNNYNPRPIQSIDGTSLTLAAGHGFRRNQAVEVRDSSSAAHNGVWVVDQASSTKVTLRKGPSRPCTANCGTITPRVSVQIAGVGGNTAANGSHLFHVLSRTQIELPGTSGNGSYTSGGFLSYNPDIFFLVVALERNSERIIFDRCYIHGWGFPTRVLIVVGVSSANSALIDSYFEDFSYWGPVNPISGAIEEGGRGSTTVDIGNGGRVKISNNAFLNSPGVPLFVQEFRDAREMTPTDITITRNLFFNSDRLRSGSAQSDGRRYVSSHLLEFKKGKRILIDGNVFDGCWADRTPTGPAIAFSPRGINGVTDNVVSDVTVTNNVFRRVSHAIYVIGEEGRRDYATDISARFKISNNLFAEINYWKMHAEPAQSTGLNLSEGTGAGGAALWVLGPVEDLEFTHNTVLDQRGTNPKFAYYNYGRSAGVVIRHNIFPHNQDLAKGGLTEAWALDWAAPPIKGSASDAFRQYFVHAPGSDPNSAFSDNVVIPGVRNTFTPENFDSSAAKVNFTKADCEEFYKGFFNITCAGTGKGGETANQRFRSIFGSADSFQPAVALPGNPGIDAKGLENALGMTVRDALRAGERAEQSGTTAVLSAPAASGTNQATPDSAVALAADARPAADCEGSLCAAADQTQLETLLASSACGDRIVLPAGESLTVSRPIALDHVDCPAGNPLVITTSAESELPAAGGRITPSHAALLARLEATGFPGTVFTSDAGSPARGIVLRGLEFVGGDASQAAPLLRLDGASDIVVDQCYFHALSIPSGSAALLAGERISVTNSFLEGYCMLPAGPGASTVVAAGAGPVSFRNNYIEASAAALSGSAGAAIEFRHNTVQRLPSHNPCRPEWDGHYRSLGALVDLAASSRGVFEFNLFEDSWAGNPQYPAAVSLAASASAIFRSNTFRGVRRAFQLAATDPAMGSAQAVQAAGPGVVIEGNLLEGTAAAFGGGLCGAPAEMALLGGETPSATSAAPFRLAGLPLGCNSQNSTGPPGSVPEVACGEVWLPAQIFNLDIRSEGNRAIFQYEVSAPGLSAPCVVEVWPAARGAAESIAVADHQEGPHRSAAVPIERGSSYDYRLMCGGDMRRGTFQAGDAGPPAAPVSTGTQNQR
jgi:hypothetical protein